MLSRLKLLRQTLAVLMLIAVSGAKVSADSMPFVCPVGTTVPAEELCGNGSVIALIRSGGDPERLLAYMQRFVAAEQPVALASYRRASRQRRFSDVRDVQPLESFPNLYVLRMGSGMATQARLARLQQELCGALNMPGARELGLEPCSDSAATVQLEPSLRLHAYAPAPDDPRYTQAAWPHQWGLKEANGIGALAAWQRVGMVANLRPVTVAVLDTGVAAVGDELEPALLADGADFTVSPPLLGSPGDQDGHGTGVASVIAAKTNNHTAMAGVVWSGQGQARAATLMPVRIMRSSVDSPYVSGAQEQCTHNLLGALRYAVDPDGTVDVGKAGQRTFWDLTSEPDPATPPFNPVRGAKIVNLSAGFHSCSTHVGRTLQRIERFLPEVLFVVAVPDIGQGAPGRNMDGDLSRGVPPAPDYPTSYPFNNILSVTATGQDGCVMEKYGKTSVDIAAPGMSIVALHLDGSDLPPRTGTSFAAPHVSGAAALLKSLAPATWGFADIKQYLLDSSDRRMCMHPVAEAARCRRVATDWQSICDGVAEGLLNLDAATAPPVAAITPQSNGIEPHAWRTDRSANLTWAQTFVSGLCQQVDADLMMDLGSTGKGTNTLRLSDSPLNVSAKKATFDRRAMARIATNGMLPTAQSANARIRLQCLNSNIFRMSGDFTIKRVN